MKLFLMQNDCYLLGRILKVQGKNHVPFTCVNHVMFMSMPKIIQIVVIQELADLLVGRNKF